MSRALTVVALLLASATGARGQADLRFETVSIREGLPQSFATSVARDSLGFLWIGTSGGLARYDGYQFDVFEPDPDDPASLPHPVVRDLLVASDGVLWVAFNTAGAARFVPETQRFERLPAGPAREGGLPNEQVFQMAEASDGSVWFGTASGAARLDPETGEMSHLRDGPGFAALSVTPGSDGAMWIAGSRGRLYLADAEGLTRVATLPARQVEQVLAFGGWLWAVAESGLFRIDPASGAVRQFDDPVLLQAPRTLFAEPRGWLWIGTAAGFVLFDTASERVLTVRSNAPGNAIALPTATPTDVLFDRSGIFWVATGGAGVASADFLTSRFPVYQARPGDSASLASSSLRAIASDSASIWAGLNDAGLNRIDRET
ncbi:MAG: two-component regulator propeller domain-containing protein, partial [Bacteroidota bacterium]